MRIPLFLRVLPVYLAVFSLISIPVWQRHEAAAKAAASELAIEKSLHDRAKTAKAQHLYGIPRRIVIPRLSIDLKIVDGVYSQEINRWSVADGEANYAVTTAKANNQGDKTLVYGHWTAGVFGRTKQLEPGDIIYVYTDNNHVFKYIYRTNTIVKPTDVHIFDDLKGEPGLVLMTCDGIWAEYRRLMFADLEVAS